MTAKQKALAWGMGILVWVNVLSVLLSGWQLGFVDWTTVAHMGLIAFPPLAVGAVFLYRFRPRAGREEVRLHTPHAANVHAPVRAGR